MFKVHPFQKQSHTAKKAPESKPLCPLPGTSPSVFVPYQIKKYLSRNSSANIYITTLTFLLFAAPETRFSTT